MTNDDYKLPKLPPLEDVLRDARRNVPRRVEKALNDENLAERGLKKIVTISCPVLETALSNNTVFYGSSHVKNSTINIVNGQVICPALFNKNNVMYCSVSEVLKYDGVI
jgi:hypothetical protein